MFLIESEIFPRRHIHNDSSLFSHIDVPSQYPSAANYYRWVVIAIRSLRKSDQNVNENRNQKRGRKSEKGESALLVFCAHERLVIRRRKFKNLLGNISAAERTGSAYLSFLSFSLSFSLLLAATENSFSTEPPFILAAYITALAENLISWQISLRAHGNFRV